MLSRTVGILWWLHLNIGASSAKVALVFSIVASSGLVIGWRRLMLCLVVWCVSCLTVPPGRLSSPTCPSEWLASLLASSASADEAAEEE